MRRDNMKIVFHQSHEKQETEIHVYCHKPLDQETKEICKYLLSFSQTILAYD